MQKLLSWFVPIFGCVCGAIALAHIVIGPAAIFGSVSVNATMDSEDRFFGALFLGFGAGLVWCSKNLVDRSPIFGALLLTFFLGGISRVISALLVGLPNPLFVTLTFVELILPPVLWVWHRQSAAAAAHFERQANR